MNRLLERQIQKYLGSEGLDTCSAELQSLCEAISDAYDRFDEDHRLMERAFDLRAEELANANEALKSEIEERRLVEAALRESEETYRGIVELANDGIAILQDAAI